MTSRAVALALALSVLYSRGSPAAPLPVPLSEALRERAEATRLAIVARVADAEETNSKLKKESATVVASDSAAKNSMSGESGITSKADVPERPSVDGDRIGDRGGPDSVKKQSGKGKKNTEQNAKGDVDGKNVTGKKDSTTSGSTGKSTLNAEVDSDDGDDADERSKLRRMTTSEMIAEARAHSSRLMKGGFVEFIEWLFVFILVAPGTFPAIGCLLLSCTSFWRRRLANASTSTPTSSSEMISRALGSNAQSAYQRVPHGEHGALVARARVKGVLDERDSEIS